MTPTPTVMIRPVATLGVSQLLVLLHDADGTETEVLRCPGHAPAAVTAEIEKRAGAAGASFPGVLVDLESCDWVDSGVLGLWVSWHHALARRGGHVVLCQANDRIRNILRVSQLDQLFDVHGTLAAGLKALGADGSDI